MVWSPMPQTTRKLHAPLPALPRRHFVTHVRGYSDWDFPHIASNGSCPEIEGGYACDRCATEGLSENDIVELADGRLMAVFRTDGGDGHGWQPYR
eukprot:SAG31_NODE_1521_length_8022_cov_17.832261_6_plen_95_part_00